MKRRVNKTIFMMGVSHVYMSNCEWKNSFHMCALFLYVSLTKRRKKNSFKKKKRIFLRASCHIFIEKKKLCFWDLLYIAMKYFWIILCACYGDILHGMKSFVLEKCTIIIMNNHISYHFHFPHPHTNSYLFAAHIFWPNFLLHDMEMNVSYLCSEKVFLSFYENKICELSTNDNQYYYFIFLLIYIQFPQQRDRHLV